MLISQEKHLNYRLTGEVNIKLSKTLYFDAYNDNKSKVDAFILIDAATTTAGAGFIR
jgi:sulfate adenylyltransferase subunit 1